MTSHKANTPHDPDAQATGCAAFVAGLADAGVTTVFVSPGSRNTPLTLALAVSKAIRDVSVRDERSAGFMALGFAKATGRPAAVLCTSGSAPTHYFPSVVEADQSNTPLIVLTADRPRALRGTYAPQTMDQTNLYGSHVKAWIDLDIEHQSVRETAAAAVRTATHGIPGAVHINVPLGDPLVSVVAQPLPTGQTTGILGQRVPSNDLDLSDLDGRRVLVVAGGAFGAEYTQTLGEFASAASAPLLADPQCRPASDATISNADLLVAAGVLDRLTPDHIIRLGPLPTSKATWTWLERSGIDQTLIQRSRLGDPLGSATTTVDMDPIEAMRSISARGDQQYLNDWRTIDAAVTPVVEQALTGEGLTEPWIARTVAESVEADSVLFVGSSMPIRDIDTFAAPRSDIRIIGNRGVNGIDGSISTALGIALSGTSTTALIGDVAALHDATALAEAKKLGEDCTIVVINNDGGGIFSFLPQKTSGSVGVDTYEHHWGTPHGLSLDEVASAFGLASVRVTSTAELKKALSDRGPQLIEVTTNRDANVVVHTKVRDAVATAVAVN